MLRQFQYLACAAVVGFASQAASVSVVPACDHCGAYNSSPTYTKYAPPTGVRIRWVSVYEDGRVRLVPRAYRVRVSQPATISATASAIPAIAAPTSNDVPSAAQAPVRQLPGQLAGQAAASPAQANVAQTSAAPADRQSLANRAQALLQARCVRCHGEQRQESGLDLRSRETILKGGDSGPAIVPGQPDQSLVLRRVRNGEMPPRSAGQLSSEEIGTLQQWIAAGAPSERAQ
jgi:mono/diheme cytochrome c family protein